MGGNNPRATVCQLSRYEWNNWFNNSWRCTLVIILYWVHWWYHWWHHSTVEVEEIQYLDEKPMHCLPESTFKSRFWWGNWLCCKTRLQCKRQESMEGSYVRKLGLGTVSMCSHCITTYWLMEHFLGHNCKGQRDTWLHICVHYPRKWQNNCLSCNRADQVLSIIWLNRQCAQQCSSCTLQCDLNYWLSCDTKK